jgi:multidrug efflux system membrane fusion protein
MQLDPQKRKRFGRIAGFVIVAGAVLTGLAVWRQNDIHPRTDDAEVSANFIGIAPEVSGRITRILVQDNQLVHKGDLLFEIDPLPYQYALDRAKSQQDALEAQIRDLQRTVSSQNSAVTSARAKQASYQARVSGADASVQAAQAAVDGAQAELTRAQADYQYADNNVLRLEPLLTKQFVTVDQVDQARTSRSVKGEAVREARAHLELAQAQWASAVAARNAAQSEYAESAAELDQSIKSVALIEPLTAQRQARAAAVNDADYDLRRTKVYAPFDARVTNLSISEGAYAHAGQQIFTLIDTRKWWVVANFRETELAHIVPGMKADVYVMSDPDRKLQGTVESAGFGVAPDPEIIGKLSDGLPDVQRSLNWVHLATRFPVRVRIDAPSTDMFRLGASAMVVISGPPAPHGP